MGHCVQQNISVTLNCDCFIIDVAGSTACCTSIIKLIPAKLPSVSTSNDECHATNRLSLATNLITFSVRNAAVFSMLNHEIWRNRNAPPSPPPSAHPPRQKGITCVLRCRRREQQPKLDNYKRYQFEYWHSTLNIEVLLPSSLGTRSSRRATSAYARTCRPA